MFERSRALGTAIFLMIIGASGHGVAVGSSDFRHRRTRVESREVRSLKLPLFTYHAPDSLESALDVLQQHGEEAKLLAGGQSLVPLMALRLARPSVIVDLGRVPGLTEITVTDHALSIGSMVRDRSVERSAEVRRTVPLLSDAMPFIGHIAIRTRGTVGGSAVHADPSAEIPVVLLAVEATLVARSAARGERTIAAGDFFRGFFTTGLREDEVLTEIRFPAVPSGTSGCFLEAARRRGDFATVAVAVSVRFDGGTIVDARIALAGVADTPVRASESERVLVGVAPSDGAFEAASHAASAGVAPNSDLHGTSVYRKHLVQVLVRRALATATGRAKDVG